MLPEYEKRSQSVRVLLPTTNLEVVEDGEASDEVLALYNDFRSRLGGAEIPGILKCFATHPPLLWPMMDLAEVLLFRDGHLSRRHKEMIATLVSVQNVCPYCADSHGYHLRMNGSSREILCAVQTNNLLFPSLTEPEQALLGFAQKLNRSSHEIGRADSEMLGAHRLEQAADR